ncbi:MAG: hypothetical protein ACYC1U_08620 [Candidatus Aquicultorales bacterium]
MDENYFANQSRRREESIGGDEEGSLPSDDDKVVWRIPAGALISDTTVSISRWPADMFSFYPMPTDLTLIGDVYALHPGGGIYEVGRTATITFSYPEWKNPGRLGIYRLNLDADTWERLVTSAVDESAHTITVITDHNSDYGMFEEPAPVPALSPWALSALGAGGLAVLLKGLNRQDNSIGEGQGSAG